MQTYSVMLLFLTSGVAMWSASVAPKWRTQMLAMFVSGFCFGCGLSIAISLAAAL